MTHGTDWHATLYASYLDDEGLADLKHEGPLRPAIVIRHDAINAGWLPAFMDALLEGRAYSIIPKPKPQSMSACFSAAVWESSERRAA